MERTRKFYMNREGIGFFKHVLESYEYAGLLSVLDGSAGLVEIIYPSDYEKVLDSIMADMAHYDIYFKEVVDA